MPGANLPFGDGLYALLRDLDRRLSAIETQQNWGITDGSGIQRIRAGLQSDGTYGIRVLDSAGNVEVSLGDLGGGSYGIAVLNSAGVLQRISGVVMTEVTGLDTCSVTTFGDLGTVGPTVIATVGPSGQALITMSANVNTGSPPGGGETAYVGLSIDGATPAADPTVNVSTGGGSGGVGASASLTYLLTGLSQGSHTFKMQYKVSSAGITGNFYDRFLAVQPL